MFKPGDPNINRNGRPTDIERLGKLSNKDLRKRELLSILRKLKPHVAASIMKAVDVMEDDKAAHVSQLKAATIILDNYRKLIIDVYGNDVDPEEEGDAIQETNKPLFSLRVVEGDKED